MGSPDFLQLFPPEPQDPVPPVSSEPPNQLRIILKRCAGSAIVALMFAFLIAALTTYGVINVGAARLFLLGLFVLGVGGIVFSEWLWSKAVATKIMVGVLVSIVWGVALIRLDQWARSHGPASETANAQRPPEQSSSSAHSVLPRDSTTSAPPSKPIQEKADSSKVDKAQASASSPSLANLKQRAMQCGYQILENLHSMGWDDPRYPIATTMGSMKRPDPKDPEKSAAWMRDITVTFWVSDCNLSETLAIRDELASIHLRDNELDQTLNSAKMNFDTEKDICKTIPKLCGQISELPQSLSLIGGKLMQLASQIPEK